jgi:hypothetical protein
MQSRRRFRRQLFAALALLLGASTAFAQGSGRSLDIDHSIRAAGMGEASNAVFWGDELNQWSNPAVLGYVRGVHYEYGNTQLVPGLAADVFFRSNVLKLAGGGLGTYFAGKPFGVGSVKLDYGSTQGTDPNGNPIGTFDSHEDIESWGFGLSLAHAFESIARLSDRHAPRISRVADVSLGMNFKNLDMDLGPGAQGSTSTLDRGLLVRVSPLEIAQASRDLPLVVDLSYGWSELSYDDATISLPSEAAPVPLSKHQRTGYGAHIALVIPPELRRRMEGHPAGWLLAGLDPLLSFGYAKDHDEITPSAGNYETDGSGTEVTVANIYSYRRGHFEDPLGEINGDTEGWSVGLPIGRVAAVRYDHATIPQASNSGLPDVTREAWSGWFDALRIWKTWKGER